MPLTIGEPVHVIVDAARPYCLAGAVVELPEVGEGEEPGLVGVAYDNPISERREYAACAYDDQGTGEPPTWHVADHPGPVPAWRVNGPAGSD